MSVTESPVTIDSQPMIDNQPTMETPPPLQVLNMLAGMMSARALNVAAKFGVADHLGDDPRSVDELAALSGTHAPSLYRLLRALASLGVFSEVAPGIFAHTPLSIYLRSDVPRSVGDLARSWGDDWRWDAWKRLDESVRTGAAVDLIFGESLFDYFAHQDPEAGERFSRALTNTTSAMDEVIAAAYDFSAITTLVDVGGAHGGLLAAILAAHPTVHGVLFDLPEVIEAARTHASGLAVGERIELITGDAFQAVPPAGAYMMRMILHDWNDEECGAILRACRRAISPDGRLLVIEQILPPGNEPSLSKLSDLEMLVCVHGQERTEAEFRALYEAAGFRLSRIVPTQSPFTIIEGIPT